MSSGDGGRWVFGLCAEWCSVCRDWRATFEAASSRHPEDRFVWIDVEDDDELVGDLDIETFPTLLVGSSQNVLFFGTILPTPQLLSRLLESLHEPTHPAATAETSALLQRLVSAQL